MAYSHKKSKQRAVRKLKARILSLKKQGETTTAQNDTQRLVKMEKLHATT